MAGEGISSTADDDLRARWRAWEAMPYPGHEYPPGGMGGMVEGVDLAQTAGSVAAILDDWFTTGQLETDSATMLPFAVEDLERAVPHLTGHGLTYFAAALDLLKTITPTIKPG